MTKMMNDECGIWLELLGESTMVQAHRWTGLLQESDELTAILVTSVTTVKQRRSQQ
jgi:hypothetical protein